MNSATIRVTAERICTMYGTEPTKRIDGVRCRPLNIEEEIEWVSDIIRDAVKEEK